METKRRSALTSSSGESANFYAPCTGIRTAWMLEPAVMGFGVVFVGRYMKAIPDSAATGCAADVCRLIGRKWTVVGMPEYFGV